MKKIVCLLVAVIAIHTAINAQLFKSYEHRLEYKGVLTLNYGIKAEVEFAPLWYSQKPYNSQWIKYPWFKTELRKTVFKTVELGVSAENTAKLRKISTFKVLIKKQI